MSESLKKRNNASLNDEPTDQDSLGRQPFATNLAHFLLNAPDEDSYRIGIYGGWGEGKTSVMMMMDTVLTSNSESECLCVFFKSWDAKTADELRLKLLEIIAEALGIFIIPEEEVANEKTTAIGRGLKTIKQLPKTFRQLPKRFRKGVLKLAPQLPAAYGSMKELHPFAKAAEFIVKPASGFFVKALEGHLTEEVEKRLADKRLVVFVDDLDRVRPELLPDILLYIREALNLSNVHYVLGIAPQIVEQGLGSLHKGWGTASNFLEKIIEYPAYLPTPSEKQMRIFIRHQIEKLSDGLDAQALEDLLPYLSRNPRRLKTLLRFLYSSRAEIGRYSHDEVSRLQLYVCQMVRLEFPEETRLLCADKAEIKRMENKSTEDATAAIYARRNVGDSETKKPVDPPAYGYAPSQERKEDHARFMKLCGLLYNTLWRGGRYDLSELFDLLDTPEFVTHREAEEVWKAFHSAVVDSSNNANIDPSLQKALTSVFGKQDDPIDADKYCVLFFRLCDLRARLNKKAVGNELPMDRATVIQEIRSVSKLVKNIQSDLRVREIDIFTKETWKNFYDSLCEYSHVFGDPVSVFDPLRDEEAEILLESVTGMSDEVAQEIYTPLSNVKHLYDNNQYGPLFEGRRPAPVVREAIDKAVVVCERQLTEQILGRFQRREGIGTLPGWGVFMPDALLKVALNKDSIFHTDEYRQRLYGIAKLAKTKPFIQMNFADYFVVLSYVAAKDTSVILDRNQCVGLMKDEHFVRTVWGAAVVEELSPVAVGNLRRGRETLVRDVEVSELLLPEPDWYQRIVNSWGKEKND